jgi:hypothetical protein
MKKNTSFVEIHVHTHLLSMFLNRISLIFFFCFSAVGGMAQRIHLNQAFFLSSHNPAFTASVYDYNRASLFYNGMENSGVIANINIDPLYSGIGIYAETSSKNRFLASFNYAYHTLVTGKNHHLLGGFSIQVQHNPGETRFSPRFGFLFNHYKTQRLFVGLSAFRGEKRDFAIDSTLYSGLSLQIGTQRYLSRRYVISLLGLIDYSRTDDTGVDQLRANFLPMFWYGKYSVGVGVRTTDFLSHEILFRAMYRWKFDISLTYISGSNSLLRNTELSLRHLF